MSLHNWAQLTMLSPFRLTDWRLPSPSSTPKSANFPEPTLQTPRNDSFSTHFTDAWSTPRANAHQTPTQTPLCRRNSTCERPLSSYSQRNLNPDDPSFHVNHFSPHPNLPLPPVDPSCRLSSSPGPGPTSAGLKSNVSLYAPLPTSTALADSIMNISQMQTPPPTRDASSQRRGQRTAAMDFNTPSTIFSRRDSAPGAFTYNTADDSFMETPGQMFPTLQLTPDLGNFTNTGPMTAPIEARILWDQNGSSSAMDYQMTPARRQSFGPSSQSAPNMLSLPNVSPSISRKTSPLKRTAQSSLASISEHTKPRPRTRLVIDESGSARTETIPEREDWARQMDHRTRYPGLWDGEDSDTDSNTSTNGAHSVGGLFGELLGGPVEAPVEDGKGADNDKGDAQDALKELMERSKQRRQGSFKATNAQKLEAHNQRWAQASADLSNLSTSQTTLLDPFVDAFNPSPSNISPADMLTPSTDRSGLSSGEGTHCICSSTGDDGQLMVQCESCSNWYHLSCLGLPQRPELLPQVYICAFCTGETPTVRGGRVRDPFRSSIQAHQQQQQLSPLGYKTYQR
ncbi:hypothetical protein K490DRAFT_57974 [Saccharata proteae CBS 121410]|uniref:PHD-type domain-containing protein n=1 Tax=Saccharata proteae CBS 121410 TaxID=1314787 RepID=A0A9P4LVU4_9PEZI|nr:hypothetical protein K490DRAFT_57974 [Saccharata proteae CBS 121410]